MAKRPKSAESDQKPSLPTDKGAASKTPSANSPKTAVVLIHGMGEQRPMATLWGFVEAVWRTDRSLTPSHGNVVYAKPDEISDNFDLRRVTTRYWSDPDPRRVDFFEFYWAHLMQGNTVQGALSWIRELFVRPPSSVPRGLRWVWLLGLVLLIAAGVLMALAALPSEVLEQFLPRSWTLALAVFALLVSLGATRWLAPVAGDAARYFSADPSNVAARNTIRRAGVDVLEKLTRSGEYDRIIVVGHSLGSAIGLDVLAGAYERVARETWAAAHPPRSAAARSLRAVEKAAAALRDAPLDAEAFIRYRDAQRAYARTLSAGFRSGEAPWLVSDFVTLGSPLSKADILITRDRDRFDFNVGARSVSKCPPLLEQADPPRFSFEVSQGRWGPHHAAAFASTTWTNLYFPSRMIVFGDIVSGPVASLFGPGIRDVKLAIGAPRFRHNDYWRDPEADPTPEWIVALRRALNLRLAAETEVWGGLDDEDAARPTL
ncbi:hypothetical protein IWC96_05025 [Brevundimonas sp. BAL450]|nr:hypothetical protein [Brevundimonas sp. BAL450]